MQAPFPPDRPRSGTSGHKIRSGPRSSGSEDRGPLFSTHRAESADQIGEDRQDGGVGKVDEHTAHQWDHEERLGRGAVLVLDGQHVGHGVGGGAHAETAEGGGHHGGLIVGAHDTEYHKRGQTGTSAGSGLPGSPR